MHTNHPSFIELMNKVREIIPEAYFDEDLEGQIVIYTNLQQSNPDDNAPLEDFDPR
jgi:hypothetical protein